MNTKQAEYRTDIALLDRRMSGMSEEMAKRDLRLLPTIAGLIVGRKSMVEIKCDESISWRGFTRASDRLQRHQPQTER